MFDAVKERKVTLFIAMSLDGYIADSSGNVDWLNGQGKEDENPTELLSKLKLKKGKGIWICGGANLIGQLMRTNMVDCYHISVIPTLLGNGIPLFGELEKEQKLSLIKTQNYNGIVELIYERR